MGRYKLIISYYITLLNIPATTRSTIGDRAVCRYRSGVEQPSTLSDVSSIASGFPKTSQDSSIYSLLPIIATLCYVLYCQLLILCGFTRFLLCVLVYIGFMYCGLAVF